jgi:ketosteroid isomerase-like protein
MKMQTKTGLCSLQCRLMNRYWMALLFVPLLLAAPRQAQTQADAGDPTRVQAQADADIKHLLAAQVEAWNNGNLQGFMAGYWHSPDLTFFSGATVTKGWEPTLQRYQQRYQGEGKEMGQLEFQDLNIDLLGRNAAVVTGKWQLTLSIGNTPDEKKPNEKTPGGKTPDGKKPGGLFTLILKRLPGGWRIVHDHTSGG